MSKTLPVLTLALMATTLGTTAYASSGLTRAQVRAETLAAVRDGSIIQGDGFPERALLPALFPPAPVVAHEPRAQVEAELAQAIRTGDMPAPGRFTMTLRQESPQMYG
jgi:hypothetical protein